MNQNSITLPHISEMLPHQKQLLFDPHRYQVAVWARRHRKTTTALEKLITEAAGIKNKVFWYVCPTFNQAKSNVWIDPDMLQRIIPPQLIAKKNESELTIYFKSGSVLSIKGADDPRRLKGSGVYGVVLDEFAEMKPEAFQEVVEPILAANNGWCWMIGTPKGKNHLYDYFQLGQKNNPDWKSWLLKASESGVILAERLAATKQTMPQALYNQEFECDFLDNSATIFRNVKEAATAQIVAPIPGHFYVAGVDLARVHDWSVVSVFDRSTNEMVYFDRFNQLDWKFQKAKIATILQRYSPCVGVLDSTGIGDVITNDLQSGIPDEYQQELVREGLNIQGFKFTETSKREIVERTALWIEQQKIKLLNIPELIDEFETYSYVLTPLGKIRYSAPSGKFDDCVMSVALAVGQLSHYMYEAQNPEPEKSVIAQHKANVIARLYDPSYEYDQQFAEWERNDLDSPY